MEYVGDYAGYRVYRNHEGFLEGIKSTGRIIHTFGKQKMKSDTKRIVTNQTTTDGFVKYVKGIKPLDQSKKFQPHQPKLPFPNPDQLKLFEDDDRSDKDQLPF